MTAPPHDGTRCITRRFSLYTDVKENMNEWNLLQFAAIVAGMEDMTAAMDNFALRCKKMPGADSEPKMNLNLTSGRWRLRETTSTPSTWPHESLRTL